MRTVYYAIYWYFVLHVGCGNDGNRNDESKLENPEEKTENGEAEEFSAHSTTGSSEVHNTVSAIPVPANPSPAHTPLNVLPSSRRALPADNLTVSKSSDMSKKRYRLGDQRGSGTAPASTPGSTVPISRKSGGARLAPTDERSEHSELSSAGARPPNGHSSSSTEAPPPPLDGIDTTESSVHSEDSDSSVDVYAPTPVPEPEAVLPEEVAFTDEFDESDGTGSPRVVQDAPEIGIPPPLNEIGTRIANLHSTPSTILAAFPGVLKVYLNRMTGEYSVRDDRVNAMNNHMRFWTESNGQVLLDRRATNPVDCGVGVNNVNSPKTYCYVFMMLATSVPFDPIRYKPRDVATHIGLTQFCEENADGIRTELQNRATDPDDFDHALNEEDVNLPANRVDAEYVIDVLNKKAFAANWLSFCPNLIQEDLVFQETRILVFRHSVFRMQFSSIQFNTWGRSYRDRAITLHNVVRNRVFLDAITEPDGVLVPRGRIQELRYPVGDIRFEGGLEANGIGGVKREWLFTMGKQLFVYNATAENVMSPQPGGLLLQIDPNRQLFQVNRNYAALNYADDDVRYTDLSNTAILDRYYKAAGRYIGYSIINRYQIPVDLSLMFYAKLMGRAIGWQAIQSYSQETYNLWNQCLEMGSRPDHPRECLYCVADINAPLPQWPESRADREAILNREVLKFVTPNHNNAFTAFSQGIYQVVPKHIFECGITTKDFREIIFTN